MPAIPADTDALTGTPPRDSLTQRVDEADDLVAWNDGVPNTGPMPFFCQGITVANATRLDTNTNLTSFRFGHVARNDLERASRTAHLDGSGPLILFAFDRIGCH
jgi:hypothetical protein